MVRSQLVDRRNFEELRYKILDEMVGATRIGFDIETQDEDAHEGILQFRKGRKEPVFDITAMIVTGFSLYVDGCDTAYYVNLAHADVENRIDWAQARALLDAKPETASWICHNAPFEIAVMKSALDYDLEDVICTLQLAATCYGSDEYDISRFQAQGLGGIRALRNDIVRTFDGFEPGSKMNPAQSDLFMKVVGKTSTAAHSYNGIVRNVAYGFGLKTAVQSFFGYQMTTFKDVLGKREHMGQLTGEEVCAYGADDAYWAVRLYDHLIGYMGKNCPNALLTFFHQENEMTRVYADVWRNGMKVNLKSIEEKRDMERAEAAAVLRRLKPVVKRLLPFQDCPNELLLKHEQWYKNHERYRKRIEAWALSPDNDDDFTQCYQVAGAVSKPWAAERGLPEPTGPNFTHYMIMRTLLYDLCEAKLVFADGKVASNDEARGKIMERDDREDLHEVIDCLNELSSIEQRIKSYLNPYSLLTHPQTKRMYPQLSSRLVTRRMASRFPNTLAVSKQGYVRSFYEPDHEDHVIASIDWSQIELVLIGEFSGDPEFAKCYSTTPYEDLHTGATVDVLAVSIPELTLDLFKNMADMSAEEINAVNPRILMKPSGAIMDPRTAKKYWRTEIGKGSNFNYWYSGALSTVGETLGWTPDQMWEATDRYRTRFAVAEQWRLETIGKLRRDGYVELPDGTRRVRFEATDLWKFWMQEWFRDLDMASFGYEVTKKLYNRAGNQGVNALIQGSCAILAKRSILRILKMIEEKGYRARFMLPVHDELVFSVHKDDVIAFLADAKAIMKDHPDIINNLVIDASASIGLNFAPFDIDKCPKGQVELDEAPRELGFNGERLDRAGIQTVLDYLFEVKDMAA